jgi:hypothetical protein
MGWRDDELVFSTEYNAVQSNFNPEMGFITRKDNTNYGADFSWLPVLRKSKTIHNLMFGATTDYYQAGNGKIQTRIDGVTFGPHLQNSGDISFAINHNFDRLVNKFFIRPNLAIAPGDYKYKECLTKFTTNQKKKITGNGTVSIGEFWNGHRRSVTGTMTLRPDHHLNANLDYGYNRVNLPNGSFSSNLVGLRLLYRFSPRYFFNAYVQYNSLSHQVSSNLRFDIAHHPLSDLCLIYKTPEIPGRASSARAYLWSSSRICSASSRNSSDGTWVPPTSTAPTRTKAATRLVKRLTSLGFRRNQRRGLT